MHSYSQLGRHIFLKGWDRGGENEYQGIRKIFKVLLNYKSLHSSFCSPHTKKPKTKNPPKPERLY